IQWYLDGGDVIAYARAAADSPGSPRHVFQVYGQLDTFTPALAEVSFALAAGLGVVAHDPSVKAPDPIAKLTEIATPASGNLMLGGKPITAVVREYAPASSADGHFVATDVASARADVERFVAGVLSGAVPVVGK